MQSISKNGLHNVNTGTCETIMDISNIVIGNYLCNNQCPCCTVWKQKIHYRELYEILV